MRLPLIDSVIDERFLIHRLRSTSTAGIAASCLALALFTWHFFAEDRWDWELLAIPLVFVSLKWALMAWYRFTD